jgi:LIVCS family branched-chain amino acid:cation transporter
MSNIRFLPFSEIIKAFHNKTVLIVGFALFSMFFGAGNLIFPISIGVETQDQFVFGGIGLFCTGIFVPLIGLLSVLYSENDDLIEYFNPLGMLFAYGITCCILGLLGPLSVIPRSIMVASGAGKMLLPFLPINVVKFFICIVLATLTIHKNNIVDILGKYLTPLLLSGIVLIISLGITKGVSIDSSNLSSWSAFTLGFTQGYQTMDLLASFIFALTAIKYIKD